MDAIVLACRRPSERFHSQKGHCTILAKDDIAGGIMTPQKLRKIKAALGAIQASPKGIKYKQLVSLAQQLGRKENKRRGKEPTYVRPDAPELSPPLSIPKHSGDMKAGTVLSIVEALLNDVDEWDLFLLEDIR